MQDIDVAVRHFIRDFWGSSKPLSDHADIFLRLKISGDDCSEFIDKFAKKFGIDMSNYLWYFHENEEGINIGAILFKPPYKRVKRIPITISTLRKAVETGRWPIQYPDHELPNIRWDTWFNYAIVLFPLVLMLIL